MFKNDLLEVLCQPCKRAKNYLDRKVKSALADTPAQKAARLEPGFTCPLSTHLPASLKKRKSNLMKECECDKKLLRKYEHTDLTS